MRTQNPNEDPELDKDQDPMRTHDPKRTQGLMSTQDLMRTQGPMSIYNSLMTHERPRNLYKLAKVSLFRHHVFNLVEFTIKGRDNSCEYLLFQFM